MKTIIITKNVTDVTMKIKLFYNADLILSKMKTIKITIRYNIFIYSLLQDFQEIMKNNNNKRENFDIISDFMGKGIFNKKGS